MKKYKVQSQMLNEKSNCGISCGVLDIFSFF